ncbi:unnamed protein product [Scytosiphon promiscuus]
MSSGQRGGTRRGARGGEGFSTAFSGARLRSRVDSTPSGSLAAEAARGRSLASRPFRSVPADEARRRRVPPSEPAAAGRGSGSSTNRGTVRAVIGEGRQRVGWPLLTDLLARDRGIGRGGTNGSSGTSGTAASRAPTADGPTAEEGASDQAMRLLKRMRPDELREISKAASALEKTKLEDSQKVAAFVAKTDNFVDLVGDCYICLEPLLNNIGTTKFGVVSWKCRCTVPQKAHSGCVFSKICHGQSTCGMCDSPMEFEKTRRKGTQATIRFHRGEKATDSETSDSSDSDSSDSSDPESEGNDGDDVVEEDEDEDDGDENDEDQDDEGSNEDSDGVVPAGPVEDEGLVMYF